MHEILQQLVDSIRTRHPVAYCRLVETRGSTPQKAGAAMLVFADGRQAGTLGGGCVEAEVKRRAMQSIVDSHPALHEFLLDSDYGWGDGLICGGRMQIAVQPVCGERAERYFTQLNELTGRGAGFTEVIVLNAAKSESAEPKFVLFDDQGTALAQIGAVDGEGLESIRQSLKPLFERPRPYVVDSVAYLPTLLRCRLVIIGGGHVGQAVAALAEQLDFDVWVVDDREEFVSVERFPTAQQRLGGSIDELLPSLDINSDTYCLIVTRGHNLDEQALYYLVDRGARYVGLIGSRRKIRMIFDDLLDQGIEPELLRAVHAPVGVDIGSLTVPEIAVSICAELVSHRNRNGIVPGRPQPVDVRS